MTYVLLAVLIILQYFDGLTTFRLLSKGGRELNPLVRGCINKFGLLNGLIVVKGTIALLIFWTALAGILPWWLMLALCVLYVAVVSHNFKQLLNP